MNEFTEEEIILIKNSISNRIPKHIIVRSYFKSDFKKFNKNLDINGIKYPRFSTKSNRFIKHNPFEDINDPKVQYWLGWLATDGYVSLKENRVSLALSVKDIDVIENFKKFLKSEKLKIKHQIHHKKFEIVQLSFRSLDVLNYLYSDNIGFCENKTFEFFPKFKITKDYIRGVFEGDGYLRSKCLGGTCNEFSIVTASYKHAVVLNDWFRENKFDTNIRKNSVKRKNTVYTVNLYKKDQIRELLNLIYKDADIFMKRKYNLALSIRNDSVESPKVGEPASGIPSQDSNLIE